MSEQTISGRRNAKLSALVTVAVVITCAFLVVRTILFLIGEGFWYERLAAGALLFAEMFFMINSIAYFANILRVLGGHDRGIKAPDELPELEDYPPIAIVV